MIKTRLGGNILRYFYSLGFSENPFSVFFQWFYMSVCLFEFPHVPFRSRNPCGRVRIGIHQRKCIVHLPVTPLQKCSANFLAVFVPHSRSSVTRLSFCVWKNVYEGTNKKIYLKWRKIMSSLVVFRRLGK